MAEECDINKILGRFRATGFLNHTNLNRPCYQDFSDTPSYMEALNIIKKAEAVFAALPARVRARVDNDPAKLIDFVNDPENDDELISLGLKEKPTSAPALAAPTEAGTEMPKKEAPKVDPEGNPIVAGE